LALRLHLDDSIAENGPLRVLPGTHTLGVLSDEALRDLSRQIEAIDCTVPRGGILAMRPLVVHSSSKSQSNVPRRVLHMEYAASLVFDQGLRLEVVYEKANLFSFLDLSSASLPALPLPSSSREYSQVRKHTCHSGRSIRRNRGTPCAA
jgi:ectoine hydroxylase-related dioxygenase (phytanoyl-CoA dioxygenase family)